MASIFKAYDIRGVYPDQLDERMAWKIGHAVGRFLPSLLSGYDRGDPAANTILVGRDMRKSSPALASALMDGINAAGVACAELGSIDTPMLYFAINHLNACGGVQTTASHNPADYNGFKISGRNARPIGADTGLKEIEHIATSLPHTRAAMSAERRTVDLTQAYKQHVRSFLHPLRPIKVVIDASNGMAGKMVPLVFGDVEELEIVPLYFEHDGRFVHEPNPLIEENLAELKRQVVSTGAEMGVCFDGDADRLMCVDEKGQTVRCDTMTALLAREFLKRYPGATIVHDLRCSWALRELVEAMGGKTRRERVGHAFMKKTMREANAVFGGELSGHFYYRDNFWCDSGLITLAEMLNLLSASDKPLSQLAAEVSKYYQSGEINFKIEDKAAAMRMLEQRYSSGRVDHLDGITVEFDDFWFNVRPSNTEPLLRLNLEARTESLMRSKLAELTELLGQPVGAN